MAEMTPEQALAQLRDLLNVYGNNADNVALATLRAEIARLEKDAGRYRWLRNNAFTVSAPKLGLDWQSVAHEYGIPDKTLDAAIDAAKGASHEP